MIETQNIAQIFDLEPDLFGEAALRFFRHQAAHLPLYKKYVEALRIDPASVNELTGIPFLPVGFFKEHELVTTGVEKFSIESKPVQFESSGTTGQTASRHFVQDILLYERSFLSGFRHFYGELKQYCILALLPSYLEKGNSSLVYMADRLIKESIHPLSGFYLHQHQSLFDTLSKNESMGQKTLFLGVTYALLDFAEHYRMKLEHTLVMETGGMKGRRVEMIREEVHQELKDRFQLSAIHSEYGMTELLSQAYSKGDGIFECPPWMKMLVRDVNDPLQVSSSGRGILNIIDLANIHSVCFIATDDLGEVFEDGRFRVTGRCDQSDLRGCSLMYEA